MLLQWVTFCVLHATYLVVANVEISTPLGKIEGSTELTTRLGKTIYSFRGIRYAEAPIDRLRFQPPVPTGPWKGTYNATADGAVCPQPPVLPLPMSEDCLFLNVYSTKLPDTKINPLRPVIVHLHGGGFWVGAGHSLVISPKYLLDRNVVLVTFNYRLATLGFTAINKEVPGNNGLRDQVEVLKWVKKNIKAFGGNPNSVTLYGFSAGACSINLHLVSQMSRGLFHKAVLGSCALGGPLPIPSLQIPIAQKQARLVGCPDDSPEIILECFHNKTALDFANTMLQFYEFGQNPPVFWSPVIEEDFGQERFLSEHPIKSIIDGNFQQVPVIAGVTRDEFAGQAIEIIENQTLLQQLNDDFDTWAPVIFVYERNSTRSKEVSDRIRHFYFDDQPITDASLKELGEVFADSIIGFAVNRAVNLLSKKSLKPVYYYEFTYETTNETFAANHGADQFYLFPSVLDQIPSNTELIDTMISFISNLAKTGNPNIPKLVDNIYWKEYNTRSQIYLDIGKVLILRNHLFDERYNFWEETYPLSLYLQ